jgi:ParB-like nuclease family protein
MSTGMFGKTKDYNMFHRSPYNRDLTESNVKRLMRSIVQKNLLEFKPILVNNQLEIVDGQHRLEAAKRLGIDVYYEVQDGIHIDDVIFINNQASWNGYDYMNFYARKGNENYIKLKEFCQKWEVELTHANTLLTGRTQNGINDAFKKGEFVFPKESELEAAYEKLSHFNEMINFVRMRRIGNTVFLGHKNIKVAFLYFMSLKGIEFETFMKKLEMKLEWFNQYSTRKAYFSMFLNIYNYKNHEPIVDQGYKRKK